MAPIELFEKLRVTYRCGGPTPYPFRAIHRRLLLVGGSPVLLVGGSPEFFRVASPVLGPRREKRYRVNPMNPTAAAAVTPRVVRHANLVAGSGLA
jgi:hypothetical protein